MGLKASKSNLFSEINYITTFRNVQYVQNKSIQTQKIKSALVENIGTERKLCFNIDIG